MKHAPITRLALYVRDMPRIADFYATHFGFAARISMKKDKAVLSPGKRVVARISKRKAFP